MRKKIIFVALCSLSTACCHAQSSDSATILYVHTDQLDTPRALSNQTGTVVWSWDSDGFGLAAPNEQPTSNYAVRIPLRFAGQYADLEAGTYQNNYRDYDPSLGRYVESDPIGLYGGPNTYAYVENQPTMQNDMLGLMGSRGNVAAHQLPSVNDACVQKYLRDHYGDLGGKLTNFGNLQQYDPGANSNSRDAMKEAATVGGTKVVMAKAPGVVGDAMTKAVPASEAIGYVVGRGLTAFSSTVSGIAEVAGAFLTPFATTAMAQAREACKCQAK